MEALEKNLSTIIESLTKYSERLKLSKANYKQYTKQDQNYYQSYMFSLIDKIQAGLLDIESFLKEQQLQKIWTVISLLFQIVQDGCIAKKKYGTNKRILQEVQKGDVLCCQCSAIIEKKNIDQMKQRIGMTQLTSSIKNSAQRQNKMKITKFDIEKQLKPDRRKSQELFAENLDIHLTSLMNAMQQQFQGKTYLYLTENFKPYSHIQIIYEEEKKIANLNQRQLQQIQEQNIEFTKKVLKELKTPLKNTFTKFLNHYNIKKQQKNQKCLAEAQAQTIYDIDQKLLIQQSKIMSLQNQLNKLKNSKQNGQFSTKGFKQVESQLRKQLRVERQDKVLLKQKIVKLRLDIISMQNKLNYSASASKQQISRLQNIINQLKGQKIQDYLSKNSMKSITRFESRSTLRRLSKKSDNIIKEKRPSVDSFLFESQKQEEKSLSKFAQNSKKRVSFRRRMSRNPLQVLFNTNHQTYQTSRKQTPAKIYTQQSSSQNSRKKITAFQIFNQVSFTFQPNKIVETQKIKQPTKPLKSLIKKQPSSLRKMAQNPDSSIIERKSPKNIDANIYKQWKAQNIVNKRTNFLKNHIKTENLSTNQQNYQLNASTQMEMLQKIVTKLKNNKSRFLSMLNPSKHFIEQKMLPQIKGQDLAIFGNEQSAEQYENNVGPWRQFSNNDKLVIDFSHSRFVRQIVRYFNYLYHNHFSKYQQYVQFLTFPSTFLQQKKQISPKHESYRKTVSSEKKQKLSDATNQFSPHFIKQIFHKLIKYHQIYHKNCRHVQQFLRTIKFFEF